MLRPDFATASVGLVGNAQRDNLGRLHDWLIDEVGLLPHETVLSVANYQQGSFGRLPNHVLLVTDERIAYTHDGGLRSIPLTNIDTSRVGLKVSLVNGELTLLTTEGESLRFRKGASLSIQEVAQHVMDNARTSGADVTGAPAGTAGGSGDTPEPAGDGGVSGTGDQILRVVVGGPCPIRISHSGSANCTVWEVGEDGQPVNLLVNTVGRYEGTVLCGLQGPIAGLEISGSRWQVEFVPWENARTWDGSVSGSGDDVLVMPNPTTGLVVAALTHRGDENFTVWSYGATTDLLVNDIGAYQGQVRIPPGTEFLSVTASGPWQADLT
jgi:hypothetical protein